MAVVYRPARAHERDDVLSFWRLSTEVPSSTDDPDGVGTALAFDAESILLAVSGDTIVGTVVVGWDGWRGSFYRMAVHPEYRGQGIGRALVRAGEAQLVARGCRRINLFAVTEHEGAVAFWRALGYEPQPQDTRFVRNLGQTGAG
jgi:ribosomal protein S18 acetylase RimI-like enzyme